MTITVSGSSITFPDSTTQTTAGKTGTVTSVATGNGLSGGTITTSGTLVVACPGANTVGSYAFATGNNSCSFNGNYSLTYVGSIGEIDSYTPYFKTTESQLSGTWKWLSANTDNNSGTWFGVACRVS